MKTFVLIVTFFISSGIYCQTLIIGKWKEDSCSIGKLPMTWELTFNADSTGMRVTNFSNTNTQLVHKFTYKVVDSIIYNIGITKISKSQSWKIIKLNNNNLSLNIAGDRILYFTRE